MKLGVCVPYRNREAHLAEFVPKVGKYLEDRGIDYCMYFGHQADDKLFNRGAMKNIAAKVAFEEGCDYIVWHDIDMIPEEGGGADYSYPEEHPVHIATNISQMDYKLKYFEYFGGAVLFTREQVEKTNGYSNEYWDWGSEDDDLFWRCYLEGLADIKIAGEEKEANIVSFSGQDSYIKIPTDGELRNFMGKSHTIQLTCRAFQQPEKVEMYLVGNPERQYVEFPILCVPGYDYGINFNNSRALDLQFWNSFNQHQYMWCKKYDRQWSTITVTLDSLTHEARLYLNGREIDAELGQGSASPYTWIGKLKRYGDLAIYLGTSPSADRDNPRKFFKGDIREVKIWTRALEPVEVQNSFNDYKKDLDDTAFWMIGNESSHDIERFQVQTNVEDISLTDSVLPYRKQGRFLCLPHKDEGIVGGRFVKGEPSAKNERRYQTKMQQGEINYKQDGIAQVQYKLLGIDEINPKAKMINVQTINAPE